MATSGTLYKALVVLFLVLAKINSAAAESFHSLRLAFGSCIDNPRARIWDAIRDQRPDGVILLGDNIYLGENEWGRGAPTRLKYNRLLSDPGVTALSGLSQIYAIWDDHDFGQNNSEASFFGSHISRKLFDEYFRNDPRIVHRLPGSVAGEVMVGDVRVLLTDNRSFRRNPRLDDVGATFGSLQLEWISSRIHAPGAKAIVFASGGEVLARGGSSQKLASYPHELDRLIKIIEGSSVPVVIISGDPHYAAIRKRHTSARTVYEVTSSPLTAPPRDPRKLDEEGHAMLQGEDEQRVVGVNNFGVLTFVVDATGVRMVAEIRDDLGRIRGREEARLR